MIGLPNAILFDLDDTIITEGPRAATLLLVAEHFEVELRPFHPNDIALHIEENLQVFWTSPASKAARLEPGGNGLARARQSVIMKTFRLLEIANAAEIAIAFAAHFTRLRSEGLKIYPDAKETILALRSNGVRLGLVTNGAADIQRAKIAQFDLSPLFDHIQIEGEHGFGKPDKRAYLHALGALGVGPRNAWMVGDHLEWEVAAPQRLGMIGIWHDHRGIGLPEDAAVRPDRIIRQLPDLLDPAP